MLLARSVNFNHWHPSEPLVLDPAATSHTHCRPVPTRSRQSGPVPAEVDAGDRSFLPRSRFFSSPVLAPFNCPIPYGVRRDCETLSNLRSVPRFRLRHKRCHHHTRRSRPLASASYLPRSLSCRIRFRKVQRVCG